MIRIAIIIFTLLSVALFTVGCASGNAASTATAAPTDNAAAATTTDTATTDAAANGTLELTLDQLKQYDGQNGNPAYVAVDGVIYDVTNVPQWAGGVHHGYSAGTDVTDAIKSVSPHGVSVLSKLPVVGKIVAG
jgi:predicted heme/steroid binding protein